VKEIQCSKAKESLDDLKKSFEGKMVRGQSEKEKPKPEHLKRPDDKE